MSHADLVAFALAVIIGTGGAVALIAHALRPPPKDRLLLWIGLFAVFYAVRLANSIGALALLNDAGREYVDSALNYAILVPAILFVEELYGRGWHDAIRWLAVVTAVYGVIAFGVDLAAGDPHRVPDPALLLFAPGLLAVFVAGRLAGYRPPPFPEWRVLVGGFAVFMLFVLDEHAIAEGLVPWKLRIEPIGMLIFNGALAYIAVSRFFSRTRQLVAIDKEMEAARRIQASILPRALPSTAGVDIAARYIPLAAVAGDFYDVVRRGDGSLAVLVADVSGHGVPAALIASMVKVAFAGEAGRTGDPAAILGGMNATLCGLFDRAYVTAVCAAVDPAAGTIAYATAGHPPPLLVTGDGVVTPLEERGMFIGMFPAAAYTTTTVPVAGGARLLLYTDGVIEAPDPSTDDLFGLDRLQASARAGARQPASAFADALLAEVSAFARRDPLPHDDVTVVVLDVGRD